MLHKHPYFVNLKSRKDYQEMYKYQLLFTQTKFFAEVDNCFNTIVDLIDEAQKEGFVLVKITENKYYLKKGEEKRTIEVIKEVNLL